MKLTRKIILFSGLVTVAFSFAGNAAALLGANPVGYVTAGLTFAGITVGAILEKVLSKREAP